MISVLYEVPACVHGDNQSALCNTSITESNLAKKNRSIAYHIVWKGIARCEWSATHVNAHDNEVELLTKVLTLGEKREGFVGREIYCVCGGMQFYFTFVMDAEMCVVVCWTIICVVST